MVKDRMGRQRAQELGQQRHGLQVVRQQRGLQLDQLIGRSVNNRRILKWIFDNRLIDLTLYVLAYEVAAGRTVFTTGALRTGATGRMYGE